MKKLLIAALLLLCAPAFAMESGLWYDPTRDGEGLNLNIHEGRVVAFIYTYGDLDCDIVVDDNMTLPKVGPLPPEFIDENCDIGGQRWFFISGDKLADGEASGFLYITRGVDFPTGIQDPENPFNQIVGEPIPIGVYILRQSKLGGWDFLVLPFGNLLDDDDDIFVRVWTFTDQLFPASE